MESSSLHDKTTIITPPNEASSNQVSDDDGGAAVNLDGNTADGENKTVENDGIAGEEGLGGETAAGEMLPTGGRPRQYNVEGESSAHCSTSHLQAQSKRRRGRPTGTGRLQILAASGGWEALNTAGGKFTPHVICVPTGEDIVSRISSFSRRGPRSICILSAIGSVSNAIIHHIGLNSGSIIRYEGVFEILSLSGSYIAEMNGSHRKKGALSVLLAKSDGQVFGGGVASSLVAATPIQLVVASFRQSISRANKQWALNQQSSTEE